MVIKIQLEHKKYIYQLANNALGKDYISIQDIENQIKLDSKLGFVYVLNNKIIGFIFLEIHQANKVGFIKQIVIAPELRKKGFGKKLIQQTISYFEYKVKTIICVAWVKEKHTPLKTILTECQFSLKETIQKYWLKDSLKKSYFCPICGSPPCMCNAKIYTYKYKKG